MPTNQIRPALLAAGLGALLACGGPTPAPGATALAIVDSVDHVDALAREPMVARHPSGALFVSGYGQPGPKLWRSDDQGATWQRVSVGSESDGAVGNSDVDLAVGPDGTLYFITMGFDRKTLEGTHIAVGVSHDTGASWTWTRLSTTRFDDRPWIEVASDGVAHAIWNDGQGARHATSGDGGRTWTEGARIHSAGGSSHLAVGPHGEIAVRIVPLSASGNKIDRDVDLIAVSADGGQTWEKHTPPGQRAWGYPLGNPDDLPRWVEPIAFDSTGALFYLWSEGLTLKLGRSLDRGATWTTWTIDQGTAPRYFPYLIGGGPGELAATWFSGAGDSLVAHAARIEVPPNGEPRLLRSPTFRPESWHAWAAGDPHPTRDSDGEYLAALFLPNGDVGVVSPIQNPDADRFGFTWRRLEAR